MSVPSLERAEIMLRQADSDTTEAVRFRRALEQIENLGAESAAVDVNALSYEMFQIANRALSGDA